MRRLGDRLLRVVGLTRSFELCTLVVVREPSDKEPAMYERTNPNGVKVMSTIPFAPEAPKDDNVFLMVLWSWGFTIRQTWKGLKK